MFDVQTYPAYRVAELLKKTLTSEIVEKMSFFLTRGRCILVIKSSVGLFQQKREKDKFLGAYILFIIRLKSS